MAASPAAIYILDFDANRYAALLSAEEHALDAFGPLDASPRAASWTPPRMFWEDLGGARPIPDYSTVAGAPVLRARALDVLGDLLQGRCELLPLHVEGDADLHMVNVTRLSDALDEERSELDLFGDGRVMDIDRHAFRPERLAGETIFRVAQAPDLWDYVTDAVRGRVENAGLTGFLWDRRVWSADGRAGNT